MNLNPVKIGTYKDCPIFVWQFVHDEQYWIVATAVGERVNTYSWACWSSRDEDRISPDEIISEITKASLKGLAKEERDHPWDLWFQGWDYWSGFGIPNPIDDIMSNLLLPEAYLLINENYGRKIRYASRSRDYDTCIKILNNFLPENSDDPILLNALNLACAELQEKYIQLELDGKSETKDYRDTVSYLIHSENYKGKIFMAEI